MHARRRSDPIRPNPTQSDPIRPDPTHSDPIRPNPTQSDPIRPNPTQSDPIRPNPIPSDPIRPAAPRGAEDPRFCDGPRLTVRQPRSVPEHTCSEVVVPIFHTMEPFQVGRFFQVLTTRAFRSTCYSLSLVCPSPLSPLPSSRRLPSSLSPLPSPLSPLLFSLSPLPSPCLSAKYSFSGYVGKKSK